MTLCPRTTLRPVGGLFAAWLLLAGGPVLAADLVTIPVASAEVAKEYRLDGVVEAVRQSTLSAQTTGQVQELLVDVDDFVEQGALIIRLKDTEQTARVNQAKASLQAASARLNEAQKEYQRIKGIYARKLVSKSAMDRATSALGTARADYKAAEAALKQSEEQLAYTRVTAPFTGIVTERHIEAGETAQPGQPLISGLSMDHLRVSVDVPQSLVHALRQHASARLQLPSGDWVDAARLTVFPYADPASGTFRVRADLPAGTEDVFPGMLVKVAFVTGETQQLTVPRQAVVHRSEVTGVYVVGEDGKVSLRHVRLGESLGDKVTVLSGLRVGERVALDPVQAGVTLKRQRGD